MSRKINKRKGNTSIAVIVDGDTEKWYMELIKKHYPSSGLQHLSIKPELPDKKTVKELFELAESKIMEGYLEVLLIIDLDTVLKDESDLRIFKEYYLEYLSSKSKQSKSNWMNNLSVIINNPCLEFWYLRHFSPTTKYYSDYRALSSDLKRKPQLSGYEKTQKYYKSNPDIYQRLKPFLSTARSNSKPFNLTNCKTEGCSEMGKVFDCLDNY